MIGNSIAGSEKVGLITKGVPCDDMTAQNRIRDNEVIFVYFEVPNNRLRGLSKWGGGIMSILIGSIKNILFYFIKTFQIESISFLML